MHSADLLAEKEAAARQETRKAYQTIRE
jgi:hypothetical protein